MNQLISDTQIEDFIRYLTTEERSKATIEKYQRDIRMFALYVCRCEELCKQDVIAYKESLIKRYAVNSVNSMLAPVNTFLEFIGYGNLKVKPLKTQRRIFCSSEEELTKEEYLSLLNAARQKGKKRLWLLLQTLCSTGIRVSELRFITVGAVKQHRANVNGKGKNRMIFLPKGLCQQLLDYCNKMGIQSGQVFITKKGNPLDRSNIWREMKQLCASAGVSRQKVFPHNLRHLFARSYYQNQKDLARLADILGHCSVETTRIYILSTGEEQEQQVDCLGLLVS